MRKLLLLIFIIIGAWWWFNDQPPLTTDTAKQFGNDVHATYTTITDGSTTARISRLFNTKEAIETTIHREHFVPVEEIPLLLKQAIIATEDRRFYDHGPIDFISVGRAFMTNYEAGETLEGGSTITQQTVKNILLNHERTWSRKIEEVLLASQLERDYDKDEILELYLNTIYYGAGATGIQEAAHTYFGKDARELNLAECTLLAGLPQSPEGYNPYTNIKAAKFRQQLVLALMTEQGMISPKTAKVAYETTLHFQ